MSSTLTNDNTLPACLHGLLSLIKTDEEDTADHDMQTQIMMMTIMLRLLYSNYLIRQIYLTVPVDESIKFRDSSELAQFRLGAQLD